MSSISIDRVIDQPPSAVWATLDDFGGIHRFHPFVARSPLATGSPAGGLGAERVCTFYDGNSVHERVTHSESERSMVVEITKGTMPLRSASARLDLLPEGNGTRVRMTMTYEPTMGVLGKVMDALMMRRKFGQMLGLVLAGLDEHLRTGQDIEQGFRPAAAAA